MNELLMLFKLHLYTVSRSVIVLVVVKSMSARTFCAAVYQSRGCQLLLRPQRCRYCRPVGQLLVCWCHSAIGTAWRWHACCGCGCSTDVEYFSSTDHGRLLTTDILVGEQVSRFPSVIIWMSEVCHCCCWLSVKWRRSGC